MTDVTYQRDDYKDALRDWQLVDDVCAGERAIKTAGDRYLPRPNPLDTSKQNRVRYQQYLARAVYYNATGRTLQGLVGAVYRIWPTLVVPEAMRYVEDDIDGAGISIYQQSQSLLAAVLKRGRHGLLVDFPDVEETVSRADQVGGLIRANVLSIDAANVINWQTRRIGGVQRLSLVVIYELVEDVTEDGFGVDETEQYRVLRLHEGAYWVEIWRDTGQGWAIVSSHQPTTGAGRPWREIPFIFLGAENNDPTIDRSPTIDLASLNIAHYRNSADYEDSAYFVGQAQPWIAGLSEEWRDHLERTHTYVGSRAPIPLPVGGAFGIEQAAPNTLVKEAMDQKERQMVALGARLVERGQAVKTATEAQSENEAQHSVLSLAANNVSDAYTLALQWAAEFNNTSGEVEYTLSQDFVEQKLDPQMLTALVGAWQSGQLPQSDFWMQMRKFQVIDPEKSDEEIKAELESEGVGLALDDGEI